MNKLKEDPNSVVQVYVDCFKTPSTVIRIHS